MRSVGRELEVEAMSRAWSARSVLAAHPWGLGLQLVLDGLEARFAAA